jgi:hypothetical protein
MRKVAQTVREQKERQEIQRKDGLANDGLARGGSGAALREKTHSIVHC